MIEIHISIFFLVKQIQKIKKLYSSGQIIYNDLSRRLVTLNGGLVGASHQNPQNIQV